MAENNIKQTGKLLSDIVDCMNLISQINVELQKEIKQSTKLKQFEFLEEKYLKLLNTNAHLSELHQYIQSNK